MKIIISPPFGNYINVDWATSVRGTYTVQPRKGLIWNTLKSLRPTKGGWRNKIGLRNKGIASTQKHWSDMEQIWSLAAIEQGDWEELLHYLPIHPDFKVELNVGCPNVGGVPRISETTLRQFAELYNFMCVKLPGREVKAREWANIAYYECGVKTFHACNTIPTTRGGISGRELQEVSLQVVERLKDNWGDDVTVIGGGGIYSVDDVKRYYDAGADVISLSTVFFAPWKIRKIKEFVLNSELPVDITGESA